MTKKSIQKKIAITKQASLTLLDLAKAKRKQVLLDLARALVENQKLVILENLKDVKKARLAKREESFVDRLKLDKKRVEEMAQSVKKVAGLKDTIGQVLKTKKRPSGIEIKKVVTPLGLIAIIFESRPNVTVDAFTLAFKAGNAVILKGGSEIIRTNQVLVKIIKSVLKKHHIDQDIVLDLSALDRNSSQEILVNKKIDCLIPRGGKNLIENVVNHAKVPVIHTGASVVHTFVDEKSDLSLAKKVIMNAKTRRVSICNALDVLILHKAVYQELLLKLVSELNQIQEQAKKVELRADKLSYDFLVKQIELKKLDYPKNLIKKAKAIDFDTEFLDYVLAVKVASNFKEALEHIKEHTLGHSEAIISNNKKHIKEFFTKIDAACLYLNTSTQFSDGGEFGLGSEIGISTQKLHTRGPFSYESLTTYKYLVRSEGAVRS
jgi:glutamate-5-semialdehyde dehydrogenase